MEASLAGLAGFTPLPPRLKTVHRTVFSLKSKALSDRLIRIPLIQIKKRAPSKVEALFWLGWRDSDPRDAGVKVLCLTAWRQPNIQVRYRKKAFK